MVVVIKVRHSRYVRSDLVMVAMMVMMAGMATPGHVSSSWSSNMVVAMLTRTAQIWP
jgi:hypothetical protein